MKKSKNILLIMLSLFVLVGCSCIKKTNNEDVIEYEHYLRGGKKQTEEAKILWEYSNGTFTKYQVAYTSYVCSDISVNYSNVIYIELTSKGESKDSLIRNISFSTIDEDGVTFNVGLWGDYKEALGSEFYTGIETELLSNLKYAKYDDVSKITQNGYGNYKNIEGIDSDLITGGTISASNVVSIVKAIFDYHIENYY